PGWGQVGAGLSPILDGFEHVDVTQESDRDQDREPDEGALAFGRLHRAGVPAGGGLAAPPRGLEGAGDGGFAAGCGAFCALFQAALIRNCSLSPVLVTGAVNSTLVKNVEDSSKGMSWFAAPACPVISMPCLSMFSVRSQASDGMRSVSSFRTGSTRRSACSIDWIVSIRRLFWAS